MQDLHSLETHLLVDMLVAQMEKYSRMVSEGASDEEFARCNLMIRAIQAEMESRKHDEQMSR